MKKLVLLVALLVTSTSFALTQKPTECRTVCNNVNMDGSGATVCNTVCD